MKNKKSSEYENFTEAMEQLIKVPHNAVKKLLDEEKKAKKRKKLKVSGASREAV
ncbi:MAG TPA: hypothetical protein VIH72_11755 [Candidatus Acidoferrales bacterium]|jgi:hypothetical protein